MNPTMAEKLLTFGYEDHGIKVCLAPDVELRLFLDGSAVYESRRQQVIYPNCWDKHGDHAFQPRCTLQPGVANSL